MHQNEIASQMLAFKKFAFDSACSVISLFQEQTEKMVNLYLEQATFLPEEGQNLVSEWFKAARTGREFFKKTVDDGFKTAQSYLA